MDGFVTIDTLYLHIKYPDRDVFDYWNERVKNIDTRILRNGFVVGDNVVRNGSCGYKVSVWQHDARIYLTDQVDNKCGEGKGMGAWLQLGPKFLIHNVDNLHEAVNEFITDIGIIGDYPITVSRLDIAVDLLGTYINDQETNYWKQNWVGRSKISSDFYNSRTSALETINIGSRKSPIFLRIYDKVAQSINEGDYKYWKDVWNGFEGHVTRVEWEIKPKDGNFSEDLVDFSKFNGFSIRELIIYLIDWGRLCEPEENDSNRWRWKDSVFWSELRGLVEKFCGDVTWPTSRFGKSFHGTSEAYTRFVSGTISGAMARLEPENPSLINLFDGLNKHGEPMDKMLRVAKAKAKLIKRL